MSDVLKQVEEALEYLLPPFNEGYLSDAERQGFSALTALRGLEWEEIGLTEQVEFSATVGKWSKSGRKWVWVTDPGWRALRAAKMSGYTHFCRPILPTPPKREEAPCKS